MAKTKRRHRVLITNDTDEFLNEDDIVIEWHEGGGRRRAVQTEGISATLSSHQQNGRTNAMHLYITREVTELLDNEFDRIAIGTVPGRNDFFALMPRRGGVKMVKQTSGGSWVSAGTLKFHAPGRYEGKVVEGPKGKPQINFKLIQD